MKLPDTLLQIRPEEPYAAQDGDIEIASLIRAHSEVKNGDMATEKAPQARPKLFEADFGLSAAGLRAVNVLKSLKDSERMKILRFLLQKENSVGVIADHLETNQPATSHHLKLLRVEGLLNMRRDGKLNIYSISDECRDAVSGLIHQLQILGQEDDVRNEESMTIEEHALTLKMLAEKMRLQILEILHLRKETIVNDICELLSQSQPGVSHHLALMREAEILSSKTDGKTRPYKISAKGKSYFRNLANELQSMFFEEKEESHRNEQTAEQGQKNEPMHDAECIPR